MDLNDSMKGVVSKAILDSFTLKKQKELIQEAIKDLLTSKRKYPGTHNAEETTPIGEIFERAVFEVARELVTADLEKNEAFKAEVRQLYQDAWRKTIDENREKLISALSDAMGNAMRNMSSY